MNEPADKLPNQANRSSDAIVALDQELVQLLRCPQTGTPVHVASESVIEELNSQIAAGTRRDSSGEIVTEPLQSGLVSECQTWLYPVRDSIPTMIAEEAIRIST